MKTRRLAAIFKTAQLCLKVLPEASPHSIATTKIKCIQFYVTSVDCKIRLFRVFEWKKKPRKAENSNFKFTSSHTTKQAILKGESVIFSSSLLAKAHFLDRFCLVGTVNFFRVDCKQSLSSPQKSRQIYERAVKQFSLSETADAYSNSLLTSS